MEQERSRSIVSRSVADGGAKFGCSILLHPYEVPGNVYLTLTFARALRAGCEATKSPRASEWTSAWVSELSGTCENPFCAGEGRCQAVPLLVGRYEGAEKKSVHLLREARKKRPGRAARGGYVTRRKKGGRAKREAVNLGLLLGNRNSF